jgi:shikimate dehydrogenase
VPPDPKRTFCVIGDPIGHSLSPAIHRMVFLELGLDFDYEAVRVPAAELSSFVAGARAAGRPGFNVTIPHKESVIPFLDSIDETAVRVGAANTVRFEDGKLRGFNTDVHGCRFALERARWNPAVPGVVLLGAGGAARAAAAALASLGCRRIDLFEIDASRLERFASQIPESLGLEVRPIPDSTGLESAVRSAGLVVNATPVGMWPRTGASPMPDPDWIPASALVFDMVPNPVETRLLAEAGRRGSPTVPGIVMLVAQALAADGIWLSRPVPDGLHEAVMTHCVTQLEAHGHAPNPDGR